MTTEKLVEVLQKVHELTQQNAPESAGAAWGAFIEDVIYQARSYTRWPTALVVLTALQANDITPDMLGLTKEDLNG